jgi:Leucine-rich repeat (LRR) protein
MPDTIGNLTGLKTLDLSGCKSLTTLPAISKLTVLKAMNLNDCKSLKTLPVISKLTGLTELDLNGCDSLRESKKWVDYMIEALRKLDASSIRGLIEILGAL